jgi:hypothetical protein
MSELGLFDCTRHILTLRRIQLNHPIVARVIFLSLSLPLLALLIRFSDIADGLPDPTSLLLNYLRHWRALKGS